MFYKILDRAIEEGATDLHLSRANRPIIRSLGRLRELEDQEVLEAGQLEEIKNIYTGEDFYTRDISETYRGKRLRIHIYRQADSYALAIRFLDLEIASLEDLNLPASLADIGLYKEGLVLVTGITGSGKSSTVAAILEDINRKYSRHIISLEDPIEYIYENKKSLINQREIGRDVLDYSQGLVASLRQDPDIIMLGEMRDLESIRNVLSLTETGHLVISTIHSRDPVDTISRIVDVFPGSEKDYIRRQLAKNLRLVISQRLIEGGNQKMLPVCEIMENTRATSKLIEDYRLLGLRDHIHMDYGRTLSRSFEHSLLELVGKSQLTIDRALANSEDPARLKKLLYYV